MRDLSEPPAFAALRGLGIEAPCLTYAYAPGGGTPDAARKLGIDGHLVVKSLVFDDGNGGNAVLALMHGDMRVSVRKLERLSGICRLKPSAPELAEALTGFKTGGITPFGMPRPLPVYAEESLFAEDILYINAGARGAIAVIPPEALRIIGAIKGDLQSVRP